LVATLPAWITPQAAIGDRGRSDKNMRLFSPIPLLIGALFLYAGGLGLVSLSGQGEEMLSTLGSRMHYGSDHFLAHWRAMAYFYLILGIVFILCGVGMLFKMTQSAVIWLISTTGLWLLWTVLLIFPLPYGFQRVGILELIFLTVVIMASWVVLKPFSKLKIQTK
jgi:hypothetical protein